MHRIALSVNELFASKPSEFVLHAADVQKSDWREIGKFKLDWSSAKSTHHPQGFDLDESVTHRFVKFLKYEMLSHQEDQNEPLCVLTSFQAFGFGEHAPNDDDDDDEPNRTAEPDPGTIPKIIKTIQGIFIQNSTDGADADSDQTGFLIAFQYFIFANYVFTVFSF